MPRPPAAQPPATRTKRRRTLHDRRRHGFGTPGISHILLTLLVAVGAFNSQNNLLFVAFGVALGLLIVSGFLSGAMLMGLEVMRERLTDTPAGRAVTIRYRVRNHNRFFPAGFALSITEADGAPVVPRSWLSRILHREAAPPLPSRITPPFAFLPLIRPGTTALAEARVLAQHRGVVRFSTIRATTTFPFGLMVKTIEFDQPDEMVVTPEPAKSRTGTSRPSVHTFREGFQSSRPGHGDEFFALREYTSGDAPRQIAWRASARRGSLLVRQNAAPTPQRLWIVLFLRTAPNALGLDERAIALAAGVIEDAVRSGMAIGLAVPLPEVSIAPRTGTTHVLDLLRSLGALELGADDARGATLSLPADVNERSSQLVIVSTPPTPPLPSAARRRATVIIAQLPTEAAPPTPAAPVAAFARPARQKGAPP